jgi:hypothetical protein
MSHPFGLFDGGPTSYEGPGGGFEPAELATIRTGLFVRQLLGLLLQEQLQRALRHSLGGGAGNLFHGSEIDIQARPLVAESPLGDDFSPLRRQMA